MKPGACRGVGRSWPPDGAKDEAEKSTWTTAKKLAAKIPERIQEQLDGKRPVTLSVMTFPSWDYPTVVDLRPGTERCSLST